MTPARCATCRHWTGDASRDPLDGRVARCDRDGSWHREWTWCPRYTPRTTEPAEAGEES